jgi:hypothetical protein
MTNTDRFPTRTTALSRAGRRSLHTELESRRRPSTRLISEAVVASYIHDISQRHRSEASDARSRRPAYHA